LPLSFSIIQPLDFNLKRPITPVVVPKSEENPVPALDFEFQDTSSAVVQTTPTAATETAPVLDFKLELQQAAPVEIAPAVSEEIKPLDFSFSIGTPAPVAEKTTEPAIEFDLSSLSAAAPVSESATQTDLSSDLDFKLDHAETKPAATGVTFDIPATSVQTATDQHDPLVQSFPELLDINEASLNL